MNQGVNEQASKTVAAETSNQSVNDYPPGTMVRKIKIFRKPLAVEEQYVALVRSITTKKRKKYIKTSNIPIKDFSSFMQSLSKQFKGNLASIKDGKLKKLTLPLMNPSGIGLPEVPDENANKLVVVSIGQWNGVLFCSDIDDEPLAIKNFDKAKNGDILGQVTLENNEELSLLNLESVLKREGFLSMV